jgi:hypothetical protein
MTCRHLLWIAFKLIVLAVVAITCGPGYLLYRWAKDQNEAIAIEIAEIRARERSGQ